MLGILGRIIEKRPWLVVGLVIAITIGFGSLLPSLEMKTSMDDFLPEDEVVKAQGRITTLFGETAEMIMIYVATQEAKSVLDPGALREQYRITQIFNGYPETQGTISVAEFVDTLCWLEFNQSLPHCTDEEIQIALYDLLTNHPTNLTLLDEDDPNEPVDYYTHPRLNKGRSIDYLDIKNYDITDRGETLVFGFEVYDLPHDILSLIPPAPSYTLLEWYMDFGNLITPSPDLDIKYRIAARIEPAAPLWEIGNHPLINLREIIYNIKNRTLLGSYNEEAYLWIQPPGQNLSFPLPLETANVTFINNLNRIEIQVSKKELGEYGIAPANEGFALPARLGNITAGVRLYNTPLLNLPWLRFTINGSIIKAALGMLQNRPRINELVTRVLERFTDLKSDDFATLINMFQTQELPIDHISLTDIESLWMVTDTAPDSGRGDHTFFIAPFYLKDMRSNALAFLAGDPATFDRVHSTLMMVQVNGSLEPSHMENISRVIVQAMEDFDGENNQVSMKATGSSIIEYEINEITMEANSFVIPLIFIVISLILLINFRKPSYVLIPLLGLTIAIVWLFGTMVLLRLPFMIMEVALIPMLMGLGVDYSVHLFHNYQVEIRKGKSPQKAISISVQDIGMAMLLATVTTFIAFLSFLTASMIPLRDFGILCAIGIAYTFIIAITLQAALRYILDSRQRSKKVMDSPKKPGGYLMKKTARLVCRHPIIILIITIGITLLMILGFFYIKTGFRTEDFLPKENPSVRVMGNISDDFPFSSQEQENILIQGDIATRNTLLGIRQTSENLMDDPYVLKTLDGTPKTVSILTIIEKAVQNNVTLARTYSLDQSNIPSANEQVQSLFDHLYTSDLYGYETHEVLHKKGDYYDATLITVYTTVSSDDSVDINLAMKTLYEDLNADIAENFGQTTAVVTGENSMMFVIMESMTDSQIFSTGICIILAALVLIVAYRNILLGLITMIPVAISTIWIIGTMYFIGYSLNVMTIMITSLTIGLGITYAIHAVERFRRTADRTGDVLQSVSETIGHTGVALMIAAITTISGFGMLMFTPVPIEQQFGIITAITILYAFLTSIFILPPVLLFWGKWRKKAKGYIISKGPPKT